MGIKVQLGLRTENKAYFGLDEPIATDRCNVLAECINYTAAYAKSVEASAITQFKSFDERAEVIRKSQGLSDKLKDLWTTAKAGGSSSVSLTAELKDAITLLDITIPGVHAGGAWTATEAGTFSLEQLQTAFESVEQHTSRLTEVAAREQLQMQRQMQAMSQSYTLMNQLQVLLNELNKTIIHGFK